MGVLRGRDRVGIEPDGTAPCSACNFAEFHDTAYKIQYPAILNYFVNYLLTISCSEEWTNPLMRPLKMDKMNNCLSTAHRNTSVLEK